MKNAFIPLLICLLIFAGVSRAKAQTNPDKLQISKSQEYPWTSKDLIEPADLAQIIRDADPKNEPLILNIGFVNNIKGAVKIGPASTEEGLNALQSFLKNVPADKQIVFYCGCCPFDKCPNVSPAFSYLKKLGFTNFKLLNLEDNLKTNWISKGYPMAD